MENIAILGDIIIKYGVLLIGIIGLIRLWLLRKDNRRHYITIIITVFFTLVTIYIFGGGYMYKKKKMSEIAGDFKLTWYKCEKCPECIVKLNNDGTYILLKNGRQIDEGNWDFSSELLTIFLHIENGSNNEILDENRRLSYIKNENCQGHWRSQNLKSVFDGEILQIDTTNTGYGVFSIVMNDERTQKELKYEPMYLGHPWLNDKIKVGDRIKKELNSMKFIITKPNGEKIELTE